MNYRQEFALHLAAELEEEARHIREVATLTDEERDRQINPDYYDDDLRQKDAEAYRWHQIGAHERVYRRRRRQGAGFPDQWYKGPPASLEEREQAYNDLAQQNPHWGSV